MHRARALAEKICQGSCVFSEPQLPSLAYGANLIRQFYGVQWDLLDG